MTPAQAAGLRFRRECWCECAREQSGAEPPVYHENGEAPEQWCVLKHHYHCAACRKLLQIG